jgi:chemotaxis protein methyltransferase WspC
MGLADVEHLLKASMGLNVASIGSATIARAVQERVSACNLDNLDAYVERVRASGTELQALIEAGSHHSETWFFRPPRLPLARVAVRVALTS